MRNPGVFVLPLAMIFFLVLMILLLILSVVITSVFRALGFSPLTTIAIFFLSLVGSTINIPLYSKKTQQPVRKSRSGFLANFLYPQFEKEYRTVKTTVAINLGGAVIPTLISAYLFYTHSDLILQFSLGILVVAMISYRFARVIPGMGISLPLFIPPIVAAITAIALPGPDTIIAFVSGVTGVLIGADLMNLTKIEELQSTMMSIGGAGTFDGIFLTGIVSVLIAAI